MWQDELLSGRRFRNEAVRIVITAVIQGLFGPRVIDVRDVRKKRTSEADRRGDFVLEDR
jgi:hypothetical protein